jgi:hypothetical protein
MSSSIKNSIAKSAPANVITSHIAFRNVKPLEKRIAFYYFSALLLVPFQGSKGKYSEEYSKK